MTIELFCGTWYVVRYDPFVRLGKFDTYEAALTWIRSK
jgi:hypothetical protein